MSGSEKGGTETLGKKNQEKEVQMKERQGKKTKRAKEEEDYRRYPLWDNYRAAFSKFWPWQDMCWRCRSWAQREIIWGM